MTYEEIRARAVNGDVVGVKGTGVFSKVIQVMTKEEYSHVAMFVWHGTGLWLYEFVEGRGYQCTPASQWFEIRSKQKIFFGKAPVTVRGKPDEVLRASSSFRYGGNLIKRYGVLSLVKVWFAQIIKKDIPTHQKVCSTFIQFVWEACGFDLKQTADPGDIMRISTYYGDLVEFTEKS